ncbi:MAG: S-layer homology domain-containing protein [Clostridiales bacterium]|nr:S-layer homology domain-containing protein [Clostridiales bacterium]
MKQAISWFLVFMILFSAGSLLRDPKGSSKDWENPYIDVTQDLWSYQYITELNKAGVIPSSEKFQREQEETRGNLVLYLYNMDTGVFAKREKQEPVQETPSFSDVDKDSPYYEAVCWAYENGLVGGTTDTTFSPDSAVTRQQVCTILARFAQLEKISLIQVVEPDQFKDSLYIQDYARSGVTACQMAGIVKGYENGFFYPENTMTREECAAVVYRVMTASEMQIPEGASLVDLTPGAYDSLYDNYQDITFTALVPESEEGPVSFFDQAVFIGDSISMTLEAYCNASGALGGAQFLCAGSMSPTNMLSGKILPEYPKGSGQKPAIEESVAATGAKVVYVMLGMDNIAYGIEKATGDYLTILNNIQTANPGVQIVVQSVTPMSDASTSYSEKLNNEQINAFNETMKEYCQTNRWYYVDVAEAFRDEEGFLKKEYCSDYSTMGMHFTYDGAKVWVQYLKTHIPQDLL